MLEKWLDKMSLQEFLDIHYLKVPFALPNAARAFTRLADWDLLAAIVAQSPPPDMLVVRDGRLRPGPGPRSRAQLDGLLAEGCSVVVRHADRHDPGLRGLAEGFATDLSGRAAVQLYATPAGHHSFGWHYDAEEVFILQTDGVKEYFMRPNTVNPHPVLETMPRDMHYEYETSHHMACTLIPGDWLYIPAGYWHKARAHQASLSISIGVFAPTALDLYDTLRTRLRDDPRWRQRLPLSPPQQRTLLAELAADLAARLNDEEALRGLLAR